VRPWIGVTTYHRESSARPRFSLPSAYVDAVREAEGQPVLLTPGGDDARAIVAGLDALVLTGGGDLDPVGLGQPATAHTYSTCPERDAFEIALVREALETQLPVLAICRGLQVLNIALGGTIHAHVPDVVGDEVPHRVSEGEATGHPVDIAPASSLAGCLGATRLETVPSWHHQALAELGEGLRAVSWAPDGVVEAVEVDGAPRFRAIQWHPELEPAGAPGRRLFDEVVTAAKGS